MRVFPRRTRRPGAGGHHQVLFVLAECVPFVIALAVLAIEFTPAHFLYTGPLLIATPALAAVTMGPRGTLAAVILAVAVSVATATYNEAWGSDQVYTNFLALTLVSLASVATSSAARTRREIELDQVRRIAVAAQEAVLRPVPARLGPVRVAGMYLAAETGAQIGGDLYEAVQTRYGVRAIVGDVRGKGLPAVRAAAAVLGAFREAVHYEDDLVDVVNRCEAALRRDAAVPGVIDPEALVEGFVTVLVAQVPDAPVVEVVNRGHPPPLRWSDGRVDALMPASPLPPLGLEEFITGPRGRTESYSFLPGDRLLLHTDGVIEARDSGRAFFALPEAMTQLEPRPERGPRDFLDRLHQDLLRHTDARLVDDAAMILFDRVDGADAAGAGPGGQTVRPQ
ncbi:PP2C family protein-serine/threonine phosphatase [Streptomyces sp. NPDC090022]|uniref:PP2C family protein-serine/threonine phosphatase n=1 Tax=Streptomyces sp. NPDC090022 TaxID=3365920 RepID=UPI00381E1DF2